MRVLQFLPTVRAEVGGPARAVVDLCAALAQRGHTVTLATTDGADAPQHWRQGGPGLPTLVEVPRPTLPTGVYTRSGMAPLRELINRHDLVHVHGAWQYMNIQVCKSATAAGKPYFISVRGMLDDWCMAQRGFKKRTYLSLAGRRWLEGAARVHLTAQAELDQARKWFPRGRGVVIPNLLDLAPFEKLPGPDAARAKFAALKEARPAVLFLSRIHEKKGLEVLLRAAALLKRQEQPISLIIAGSGDPSYVESVKRLATELGLGPTEASFVGLVTGDLKLSLYQACDLFALATSQENFGFVFVEALACAAPVITTRGVDIWPELEESGGAVIADATPDAFAGAIGELLARRADLPQMGERGRQWVFRALDPQRVIERFEALYRLEI